MLGGEWCAQNGVRAGCDGVEAGWEERRCWQTGSGLGTWVSGQEAPLRVQSRGGDSSSGNVGETFKTKPGDQQE